MSACVCFSLFVLGRWALLGSKGARLHPHSPPRAGSSTTQTRFTRAFFLSILRSTRCLCVRGGLFVFVRRAPSQRPLAAPPRSTQHHFLSFSPFLAPPQQTNNKYNRLTYPTTRACVTGETSAPLCVCFCVGGRGCAMAKDAARARALPSREPPSLHRHTTTKTCLICAFLSFAPSAPSRAAIVCLPISPSRKSPTPRAKQHKNTTHKHKQTTHRLFPLFTQ